MEMNLTKRAFLRHLGIGGLAAASGQVFGDEFVADSRKLPPGSCGDPRKTYYGKYIFPLEPTMTDGPSCQVVNGEVVAPARKVPILHETDVLVIGGGPAGFAAALAAARTGAKTTLVERYGSLGGLFTNGMVLLMMATSVRKDGKYRLVTRGICEEFMCRAVAMGDHVARANARPESEAHWQPTVDPEGAKYLMDRMIEEAGVKMFFHSWCVDTIQDGNSLRGAVFASKQGFQAILAKQVVDCSGDADVLFQAGGNYRQITHAIGYVLRLGNVDRISAKALPKDADGKPLPGKWILRGNEANEAMWWGNYSLGPKGNGLDVGDLTQAEIVSRKESWEQVERMRKTPGWEKVFVASTCSQIGPRATRLIAAEKIVDRAAFRSGVRPNDVVGICGADLPYYEPLYVPYGQLLPKGIDNLLCAGRCVGAPDTIDTFRLICPCFVTGEAAGTAAALSALGNVRPRDLDVARLQATLKSHGACLA